MFSGLDGGCMIAVLPKRTFSFFASIVFLRRSACYKLNGSEDGMLVST
jgi:hypothetical protein